MVRLIKFAIAPSGQLVYRATGTAVRSDVLKNYEVRNGGVYKNGRRIGILGKGTPKQQRNIAAKDERRQKRIASKLRRMERLKEKNPNVRKERIPKNHKAEQVPNPVPLDSVNSVAEIYEAMPYVPDGVVSIQQRSMINFAKSLKDAVNAGFLTQEEADIWFDEYSKSADKRRTELWDELYDMYVDIGYDASG